jgi:hypothetical protein
LSVFYSAFFSTIPCFIMNWIENSAVL